MSVSGNADVLDGVVPAGVVSAGSTAGDGWSCVITPESAGWEFSALRVLELRAGQRFSFLTRDSEWLALPLSGSLDVHCDDEDLALAGRPGVFEAVTDFAYLPRDSQVSVTSAAGGVFAFPAARARRRLPFRYGPASGVPVELRGAGAASRQVNNFCTPEAFEADSLIACEVLTPAGNWSSYPPHRHDRAAADESELEEIYWYSLRADSAAQAVRAAGSAVDPIAYQRVYGDTERPIDILAEVRDGDAVLIPHGWHGPSMAVPGYDLYYLNVMAGPGAERAWKICDDPAHGWVRATWDGQQVDPRLPLYTAPRAGRGVPAEETR